MSLLENTYLCNVLNRFSWSFVLFNYLRTTFWKLKRLIHLKYNRIRKENIMTLKRIVKTLGLSALLGFVVTPVCAQDLIARQSPVDRRAKSLDTMVINRLQEAEEVESPSASLYNDWSNSKTHAQGYLPDVYKIDLRGFHMPTPSRVVTSNYGRRWGRAHKGLDIKVYIGDTIRAAFSGKVRIVGYDARGYGKYIVIRHNNGLETYYGHLSKQIVYANQTVRAGEPIALGGNTGRSTGSHLHFETRLAGVAINPALLFDFPHQDVTGDFYVFRKQTLDNESARATALRGKDASPGYSRENIQGKGRTRYSFNESNMPNTDYSARHNSVAQQTNSNQILYHKVTEGETLESIARQHGISKEQLCKLNHLGKYTTLVQGQILRYS